MKRLAFTLVALALVLASAASANTTYVFKLKPGMTQAQAAARMFHIVNHDTRLRGTLDCWMWGGNAKTGWRHGTCVYTSIYDGVADRLRQTWTPTSCSKVRIVTMFVLHPDIWLPDHVSWPRKVFTCGVLRS
jgi:hypothetical protein